MNFFRCFVISLTLLSFIGCSSSKYLTALPAQMTDLDLCVTANHDLSNPKNETLKEEIINRNLDCEKYRYQINRAIANNNRDSDRTRSILISVLVTLGILSLATSGNKY